MISAVKPKKDMKFARQDQVFSSQVLIMENNCINSRGKRSCPKQDKTYLLPN